MPRWRLTLAVALVPLVACTPGDTSVASTVRAGVVAELELECEELHAIRLQVFPAVSLESAAKMRATAVREDATTVQDAAPGAARAQAVLAVLMQNRGRDIQPSSSSGTDQDRLFARCKAMGSLGPVGVAAG